MRKREYYCTVCGLFHWLNRTSAVGTPFRGCPNDECGSNQDGGVSRIYSVSSMGR